MTPRRIADLETLKRSRPVLFLDDGGVMSDNALRAPQYVKLIGEYLTWRLGGTPELWGAANRVAHPSAWQAIVARLPEFASHRDFYRTYGLDWMKRMCAAANVALPPEDEAFALFCDIARHCTERVESAAPGAAEAVLALKRDGYAMYTASGTTSWELRGIVTKMRTAEAFTELYGPDITDRVKYGPHFYEAIFAHAGIDPAHALVIESDEECCVWALETGANAVWVDDKGRGDALSLAEVAQQLI